MTDQTSKCACGCEAEKCGHSGMRHSRHAARAGGNAVYGLGFIGAVVYYIAHAASFSAGFIGFLKALVWPAFLVYALLGSLGM